jgi:DNA-directed RNA polymerase subunit RPC12/RpoP
MPLLEIDYICQSCGEESGEENKGMVCEHCGGKLIGVGGPRINGTRDNFGIKRSFRDVDGNNVYNWRTWEKAGYRDPLSITKNHDVKEKIKMKVEKIKKGLK